MPPALQKRVHQEVEQARRRSGWPTTRTLAALGICRQTYDRWLQEGGRRGSEVETMKRDMDLIRKIVLGVESEQGHYDELKKAGHTDR